MDNGSILLWDYDYKSVTIKLTKHLSFVIFIKVFHRHNKLYLVINSRDETINIWNLENYQLKATIMVSLFSMKSLVIIPINNKVYVIKSVSILNYINLQDLENYTLAREIKLPSGANSFTSLIINNVTYLFSRH